MKATVGYQIFLLLKLSFETFLLVDQFLQGLVLAAQVVGQPDLLLLQHRHLRLQPVQIPIEFVIPAAKNFDFFRGAAKHTCFSLSSPGFDSQHPPRMANQWCWLEESGQ